MAAYRLPAHVERRMLALLDEGAAMFGEAARDRYAALILHAKPEPEIDPRVPFYYLRHSRDRVGKPPGRVCTPRHLLAYEVAADGAVDILGLIPGRIPAPIALPRFVLGR